MKSFEISSEQASGVPLTVRPASAEDAGRVAAILAECFHPAEGLVGFLQPWIQASLKGELANRLRTPPAFYNCLIATVDEQPVGTIEVAMRGLPQPWWMPGFGMRDRLAYVSNLAVSNAFRRKGVARSLLIEVEHLVRRWNQATVNLHVMEHNQGALRLYRSLGYRLERSEQEWPFFGPRKLLLEKRLGR
ncbi:MAG: GNAT family N-acetyltransferase [Aphanocapsa lilacina HA4352-LM1]|jgi:ribosomal protein S18 acetylase RimI-like enzyme|nr:GNAT family N-acetyltransferase [Aphanocapsa lilacina HA4352-LM1]